MTSSQVGAAAPYAFGMALGQEVLDDSMKNEERSMGQYHMANLNDKRIYTDDKQLITRQHNHETCCGKSCRYLSSKEARECPSFIDLCRRLAEAEVRMSDVVPCMLEWLLASS